MSQFDVETNQPTGLVFGQQSGVLVPFVIPNDPGGGPGVQRTPSDPPTPEYGQRGLVVTMTPINGLTPTGIFASNKPFVFQIPPIETLGSDHSFNHSDYGTVSSGEHSTPVGMALDTLTFDSMLLDWQPLWASVHKAGWKPIPETMRDALVKICKKGKPFRLTIHEAGAKRFDVNYAATLRSVHWEKRAGETDAIYITVSFKQFTSPDIAKFLAKGSRSKLPASLPTKNLPKNRNTLSKLAKFYYGDPSLWRTIAAANGLSKMPPNEVLTPKNTHRSKITIPARSR